MWKELLTPKKDIPKNVFIGAGISAFILLVGVWSLLSYGGVVRPDFLPPPGKILGTAIQMFRDGDIWTDIGASFSRVASGFVIAALLGVPIGILMGTLRVMEGALEPIFGFIRYMPASAFIPLFILWIGLDESEKMAVIFFGTFFQLVLMVMDVTKNVKNDLIEVSYTLGANKLQVFSRVILPASLPGIVDTLRITFGWAWTYLVVAELVGASKGLGYLIMQSSRFQKADKVFVGIIIIGLLGLVTDLIFKAIYRVSFSWMRKEGA